MGTVYAITARSDIAYVLVVRAGSGTVYEERRKGLNENQIQTLDQVKQLMNRDDSDARKQAVALLRESFGDAEETLAPRKYVDPTHIDYRK